MLDNMLPHDLSAPGVKEAIARQIADDIDQWCNDNYDDGHRGHLGASLIGNACKRKLWSVFRWLKRDNHGGRMQRLFNRGHREEERYCEWLRGIGFQVWEVAEDGSQHRVKACRGHFGGSLDGIGRAAPKYRIGEPILLEFKTSGTGASFTNLFKKKVRFGKPIHFDQMCIYGNRYQFKHALYFCINKNDDTLYVELVELDWRRGQELEAIADKVIFMPYAPAKISNSPAFSECLHCTFKTICHEGEVPETNCRSCNFAIPQDNGVWHCNQFGQAIPPDFILKGCPQWQRVI